MPQNTKKKIIALGLLCCVSFGFASAEEKNEADDQKNHLEEIRQEIQEKRKEREDAKSKIKTIQEELAPLRDRIDTLQGQLKNLDWLIDISRRKIENVEEQIEMKEIELGNIMEKNEIFELRLEDEKDNLASYARVLYRIESQFINLQTKKVNAIKLLLAKTSVSDTARSVGYLRVAQKAERNLIDKITSTQEQIVMQENSINQTRLELNELRYELEGEKRDLNAQLKAKGNLLEMTKGQEEAYQNLLEEAIKQQEQVEKDIRDLQNNYSYISRKINKLENLKNLGENGFKVYSNPVTYDDLSTIHQLLEGRHQSFIWPVDPSRGITAYFKDDSYKAHFGIPHYAIDVRAYQETEIIAPADGIVYKVRDNGYGYSYLILAHRDNLLTVYGHILEFDVEEGDIVSQGEKIALSGGMPGTKGAGAMTTGPHLHFEVYDNGSHVDPLDYLPVFELPVEYIPDRYFERLNELDFDEENADEEDLIEKDAEESELKEEELIEIDTKPRNEPEPVVNDAASGMGVE